MSDRRKEGGREIKKRERERENTSPQILPIQFNSNDSRLLIKFFNYLELTFESAQQNVSMSAMLYSETPLLPSVNEVL